MLCFRKLIPLMAVALVGAVILGTPLPAQAADDVTLFISVNGGATYSSFSSGTGIVTGTVATAGFTVTATGTSNQPNSGATQSQISQISTHISTNSGPIALPNVIVALSDQSFTQVTGLATLSSSISGTSGALTGSALSTFQSTIDNTNHLFAGLTSPGLAPAVVAAGLPAPGAGTGTVNNPPLVIASLGGGSQSIPGSTATTMVTATPSYSLSNQLDIIGITLLAGAQLNLTGTTTVTAVPAPAGLVLALTGLPLLGLGSWLRRRQTGLKPA